MVEAYSTSGELFRFCPQCGAADPVALDTRAMECGRCGFRYYHNVCVAVAALMRNRAGEYLFVRRAKEPAQGKLGLPGGFSDLGESLEEVASREVWEETGWRIRNLRYLASYPNRYVFKGVVYATVDAYFHGETGTEETAPDGAGEEVAAIHWLRPGDIRVEALAFESTRRAIEYLKTEYLKS